MKVHHYKGKKRTRRFFRKNSGIPDLDENMVPKRLISDFLQNASLDFLQNGNLDETNEYLSFSGGPRFWRNLDPELWIVIHCWKMLHNGLILDFLQNGSLDFHQIGNFDETNEYLLFPSGPVFRKDLDPELWIIFRWWKMLHNGLILDFLQNGSLDFHQLGNLDETNEYLSSVLYIFRI